MNCKCGKPARAKGLCKCCYNRQWRNENRVRLLAGKLARGKVCQCGKPIRAKGLCNACYLRKLRKEKHPNARSAIEIQEQRTICALFRHLARLEKSLERRDRGLCRILSDHREALKDDPERLKTGFLIGLICGEDEKARYLGGRHTS